MQSGSSPLVRPLHHHFIDSTHALLAASTPIVVVDRSCSRRRLRGAAPGTGALPVPLVGTAMRHQGPGRACHPVGRGLRSEKLLEHNLRHRCADSRQVPANSRCAGTLKPRQRRRASGPRIADSSASTQPSSHPEARNGAARKGCAAAVPNSMDGSSLGRWEQQVCVCMVGDLWCRSYRYRAALEEVCGPSIAARAGPVCRLPNRRFNVRQRTDAEPPAP
jgi:hypothetical protein